MSDHISSSISKSEQMYLITIARSVETGGPEPLPISHIAQALSLQPVSVNQMVRKLEGESLVSYHPYKGVELTDKGRAIANRTLRNRRLWQLFLVEQLDVSLEEADSMACDLEHVTPEDIAQRLSNYLGEPAFGAGGQPIPVVGGELTRPAAIPMSQLEVGSKAQILAINTQPDVARFLSGEGLRSGTEITLDAVGSQGARLLKVNKGYVEIAAYIADSIQLYPIPGSSE